MGRSLRIIDRDVVYHAVTKGNNGGPIACDATDRASVFHELDRAATRYGWEVFAWCCLTTHNHVVLRAPHGGLSEGFREMNGNHSRRTGRRHGWSGHLIRNRFFSVAVESEAHFVGCALYVARNPIAAGLCKRAEEWLAASYRAIVGIDPAPAWLAVDAVLAPFGKGPQAARVEFARLVHREHLPVSDTPRESWRPEPPEITI